MSLYPLINRYIYSNDFDKKHFICKYILLSKFYTLLPFNKKLFSKFDLLQN
jgi:hypothetical protein